VIERGQRVGDEPRRWRMRSWVASRPSIDTDAWLNPAARIAVASAAVTPRPPVVITGLTPASRSARTIARKPSCR
jgi:hypothetical protein